MNKQGLLKVDKPWLHLLVGSPEEAAGLRTELAGAGHDKNVCRILRGQKAATKAALFDELAAALQFPLYFGDNWDALDECLADLEWLPGTSYTLVVVNSEHLLEKEPDQLVQLIGVLTGAATEWARSAKERPARPFHAVFQCTKAHEKAVRARLDAAKTIFDVLE